MNLISLFSYFFLSLSLSQFRSGLLSFSLVLTLFWLVCKSVLTWFLHSFHSLTQIFIGFDYIPFFLGSTTPEQIYARKDVYEMVPLENGIKGRKKAVTEMAFKGSRSPQEVQTCPTNWPLHDITVAEQV